MYAIFDYLQALNNRAKVAGALLVASALVLGAVLSLGAGRAFAAEAPGTGPELAFTVPAGTVNIPAGGELWFAFNYVGDNSQIFVDLSGNPSLTTFTIWTPGNVHTRSLNQAVTPVGAGAVNGYTSNPDQVWRGNFNARGPYYVVVDQNAQASGSFELSVTGSGVYAAGQAYQPFAASTASAATAAYATPFVWAPFVVPPIVPVPPPVTAPFPAVSAAATPTITVPSGSGPDTARSAPSGWISTVAGTHTWYAFNYAGDQSQISIEMQVYPAGSASYTVWTPQNLQALQAGQSVTPVGSGTSNPFTHNQNQFPCMPGFRKCLPNPGNANDLLWSGSFYFPGTYYVVVDQSGPAGGYSLTISGSGVSSGG